MNWLLLILIFSDAENKTLNRVEQIAFQTEKACRNAIIELNTIEHVANSMFCVPTIDDTRPINREAMNGFRTFFNLEPLEPEEAQ